MTLGVRPSRIAMRPNTRSKMPHTTTAVVDDPVAGIVPVDVPEGLPPMGAAGAAGATGLAAVVITNVAVLAPLTLPTMFTV